MRPIDNVIEVISTAFSPLQCGVDLLGHGRTLRFRVLDDTQADVLRSHLDVAHLQDDSALRAAIHDARLRVAENGYCLRAWQLPPD